MATGRVPTTANSPLTTKGDLFGYSTAPARLAVGSDGETIVADSSTSTGLRYQGSMAAGRNFVIGGGFDIWQRGTTFALAANTSTYTADRFMGYSVGAGRTISRQATGDTTNLPFIQYAARLARDSGNTATNQIRFVSSFESVNSIPLAGKAVAYSFYARAGANYSGGALTVQVATGTGTDQNLLTAGYTGAAFPVNSTATLTTTWQRFTYTGTIAATATEIGLEFAWTPTGTAGANDWVEITGIQLQAGSVPTQFSRAGATIQGELAACQRYYYKQSAGDNTNISMGAQYSATELQTIIAFPVSMRTNPSAVIGSGTDIYRFYRNGTFDSFNNLTRNATFSGSGSVNSINLYNSSEISGTAGWAGVINGAAAGCSIAFDAEL